MKIISVVGARPNFIKIKPIIAELEKHRNVDSILLHTGQHYDAEMSRNFFKELDIPIPDINLNVGSGTHALQTARVLEKFEAVLLKEKPDCVVVVGDVNSTLACSLAASKLGVTIAHVEAGKRSYNRRMPEEINRVLTDQISDLLFVPSVAEKKILRTEGIAAKKIHIVGNVMVDTLKQAIQNKRFIKQDYGVVTLHRQENVDDQKRLKQIITILNKVAKQIHLLFPIHPRTKKRLLEWNLDKQFSDNIKIIDSVGYTQMIDLVGNAKVLLTDSGGLQAEAVVLKTPCVTLRDQTEWTETLGGGNVLTGVNEKKVLAVVKKAIQGKVNFKKIPMWDGKTAQRIVKALLIS